MIPVMVATDESTTDIYTAEERAMLERRWAAAHRQLAEASA